MKVYLLFNVDLDYEDQHHNDEYTRNETEVLGVFKTMEIAREDLINHKSYSKKLEIEADWEDGFTTANDKYWIEEKKVYNHDITRKACKCCG